MKFITMLKGLCCALAILSSHSVFAEWANVENEEITLEESRKTYDSVKRVYLVYLTITNNSVEELTGPLRVLVEKSTLPVTYFDGETASGIPYMEIENEVLAAGDFVQVGLRFARERKRLTFDAVLQSDQVGESNWTLVWQDEFEGAEIDSTKWSHEVNCNGGGNNEKQCYTDSPKNSSVENGILTITAFPEENQSLPYSSARLRTLDKAAWKYGRFEIRAKSPSGQGAFPAIWMLPSDYVYGGWPNSGEIDIFEGLNVGVPLDGGGINTDVHGTLHYGNDWPHNDHSGTHYTLPNNANPATDFHTYALEWEEGEIRWYVDGVLYQTQRKSEVLLDSDGDALGLSHKGWYTLIDNNTEDNGIVWNNAPYNEDFHLLLNFAVGGNWSENSHAGGIDASAFHAGNTFEIDYIRVYECSISPMTGQGCATDVAGYDNPVADGGTLINGAAPSPIKPSTDLGQGTIFNLYTDELVTDLTFNSYNPDGAISYQQVEQTGRGLVLDISKTGTNGNLYFEYTPSVNLVSWQEYGELVFDLKLASKGDNAELLVKLDSGWPAVSDYSVPLPELGEWTEVRISIADLLAGGNRFSPGNYADITNIISPFVVEPSGLMNLQLDNIRFEYSLNHVDTVAIFDDELHAPFDYRQYVANGTVTMEILSNVDTEHGDVAQIRFDTNESVVFFQGKLDRNGIPLQLDVSQFSYLEFEIKVIEDPRDLKSFMVKMDCGNPCGSGDFAIETPEIGVWTSYKIAITDLVNNSGSSLDVTKVDTPLVIFPAWGNQQGVVMQIDNIRLTKGDGGTPLPPLPPKSVIVTQELSLYQDQIAENWTLWDCCDNAHITEQIAIESSYGKVIDVDFFGPSGTVSGLTTNRIHDLSAVSLGRLAFDLKLVSAANDDSAVMILKVEAKGGTFVQLPLSNSLEGQIPVVGDWQHYSFNLANLAASGLNLSAVNKVLIFPSWEKAKGTVYQLDNVQILP
ncbi:MAG: beta-glucanase (GH16 family) [Alteromonadaceae bacterium]|jgi:beta-glucanase (GH16 family)